MKNNVLIIAQIVAALIFTMLSLAYAETDCTQVTEIPQVECEALVDFYYSTDGPNWDNNDGWNETYENYANGPCSYWYGVYCWGGHVRELKFSSEHPDSFLPNNNGLNGAIPESFGDLSGLEILGLSSNQITSLPESFGNLTSVHPET